MQKPTHSEDWSELFRCEFSKESDRAAVILSVAMLEQTLETLLKARSVSVSGSDDSLFDGPYAPLASFSAKIDFAYRIGLISANLCRDLHLIRRIRNDFAHDVSNSNFQNVKTKERILELMRSSGIADRCPKLRTEAFATGPRGDFEITVSWILWVLTDQAENIEPIQSAAIEWGYIRTLKEPLFEDK